MTDTPVFTTPEQLSALARVHADLTVACDALSRAVYDLDQLYDAWIANSPHILKVKFLRLAAAGDLFTGVRRAKTIVEDLAGQCTEIHDEGLAYMMRKETHNGNL